MIVQFIIHLSIQEALIQLMLNFLRTAQLRNLLKQFLLQKSSNKVSPDQSCPGIPTVSYDGKIYNTVQIGNQCWLKENLDVGTQIFREETYLYGETNGFQTNNGIIEKCCYDNDEANCDKYGGLVPMGRSYAIF